MPDTLGPLLTTARASRPRARAISTIPVLIAAHGLFWGGETAFLFQHRLIGRGEVFAIAIWIAALAIWGIISSWLALSGRYQRPDFLALWPGLWLPAIPVMLTLGLLVTMPMLRSAFVELATNVPLTHHILFQSVRVTALGAIIKAHRKEVPPVLGFGVGVPDALFGVSALALGLSGAADSIPTAYLIAWALVGAAILLSMLIVLPLTLPGPFKHFRGQPDGRSLFAFPIVLAPSLLATLFLIGNLVFLAACLIKAGAAPDLLLMIQPG